MISHSSTSNFHTTNSGLSLLEALIALGILAMVMGVSIGTFRGPSPTLALQKDAAALVRTTSNLRQSAIRDNQPLSMDISELACEDTTANIIFYPNGTARGPDLCLFNKDQTLRLTIKPLTGRLSQVKQ